jgi:hypothetical protein
MHSITKPNSLHVTWQSKYTPAASHAHVHALQHMTTPYRRLFKIAMQRQLLSTSAGSALGRCAFKSKSRSLDTSKALPVLASKARTISHDYVPPPLASVTTRQCHCSALAEGSSSATAAEQQQQQQQGSNADRFEQVLPDAETAASETTDGAVEVSVAQQSAEGPDSDGWPGFIQALWQRGYFDEHSSGKDM